MPAKIGIFGGTFNPVHNGHLALAKAALKQLSLEKIIFIPTFISPHKDTIELVSPQHRLKMLELAISGTAKFKTSRYELDRNQISYSINTVKYLKRLYPQHTQFFFLIGADTLAEIEKWKDIDTLLKLCKFAVADRQGFGIAKKHGEIETIKMKPVDISSTEIRKRIKAGKSVKGFLPAAVECYIIKNNLYR
jgi:nicotinate-nucleotide adenylyltransferase